MYPQLHFIQYLYTVCIYIFDILIFEYFAYLLIIDYYKLYRRSFKLKSNIKNEFIKIRVSNSEKRQLLQQAAAEKQNLSAYILHQSLHAGPTHPNQLPASIETLNLLNEVYHEVKKCKDADLKKRVENILGRSIYNGQ